MTRIVVNVVELNRRRHVELDGIALALSEAIAAGEGGPTGDPLDPVRELARGLRGLVTQPLPEGLMAGTAEIPVELEAPAHELDQLADELEGIAARFYPAGASEERESLDELAARLRHRALSRS